MKTLRETIGRIFYDGVPLIWIARRMVQEWRVLLLLLIAVSLVTGFFALGPLYINSVNEVDLRYALTNADEQDTRITIIAQQPLTAEAQTILEENLQNLVVDATRYKRASYTAPVPPVQGNPGAPAIAVCWLNYNLGSPPQFAGRNNNVDPCLQPFTFENMSSLVDVIEGRLPVRGPTPDQLGAILRHRNGVPVEDQMPLEEQFAQEVGLYSRGEVEAVVTDVVAEEGNVEVGSRFLIGTTVLAQDGTILSQRTMVEIVGIVAVKDPDNNFWQQGNRMFTNGANVQVDALGTSRFDWGLAFHPDAYEDWVTPVLPNSPNLNVETNYIWQIDTNIDVITSDRAQFLVDDLSRTRTELQGIYGSNTAQVQVLTQIDEIVAGFDERVQEARGPIIFLSGAVLILLLYHLITTVNLVLQQQGKEWSTISSRGSSIYQLFRMQFLTITVLGVAGIFLGLGLTRLFMYLMETIGPLSQALEGSGLPDIPIPETSYYLSVTAAMLCVLVLTLPAIPAAQTSLLRLKQSTSRPPTTPFWAQYMLDAVFIVLGLLLFLRLYDNIGGDTGNLINDLFADPDRVLDEVANNVPDTGGLNDPFNLAAPALFLTGMAMLWLRIFPRMMRLISNYTSRNASLTGPLAVWNVERDPGHYAQLVLLLIGTLALGTASIGLQSTRDTGSWDVARYETGGSVNVQIDPTQGGDADAILWERMDGVEGHAKVLRAVGEPQGRGINREVYIIGLEPEAFVEAFPEYSLHVESLVGSEAMMVSGIELPVRARELSIQAWSESVATEATEEVSVMLNAYLLDSRGVRYVTRMRQPGNPGSAAGQIPVATPANNWVTLVGDLPQGGQAPYYLYRMEVDSEQYSVTTALPLDGLDIPAQRRISSPLDSFSHTVYLDLLQVIDDNGVATDIEDFENRPDVWQEATQPGPYPDPDEAEDDSAYGLLEFAYQNTGELSLPPVTDNDQVVMKMRYQVMGGASPSVSVAMRPADAVPMVVSESFAFEYGTQQQYLEPGDIENLRLALRLSEDAGPTDVGLGTIDFDYVVRGVIPSFPSIWEEGDDEPTDFLLSSNQSSVGISQMSIDTLAFGKMFIIMPLDSAQLLLNQRGATGRFFDANQVWLNLPDREPTESLEQELETITGMQNVDYAWERYGELLREPLPSAIAGMLFVGFWVSLGLSLLDFAFYIVVTAQQRSFTFGVLRSLGWDAGHIWRLLLYEQLTLVIPALIIGSLLGAGLAYLILPFMALVGNATFELPIIDLVQLIGVLVLSFTVLLVVTALWLRRMSVNQILRLGEE